MHASVTKEFRVLSLFEEAFAKSKISLKLRSNFFPLVSLANKWWVRQVPAAAVIPAPRVVTTLIGFKAFVAGLESF